MIFRIENTFAAIVKVCIYKTVSNPAENDFPYTEITLSFSESVIPIQIIMLPQAPDVKNFSCNKKYTLVIRRTTLFREGVFFYYKIDNVGYICVLNGLI